MKNVTILLLALVLTAACASHSPAPDPILPADVSAQQKWGGASNVTQLKHLYFSEQPDAETFRIAKSRGVTTVINLRDPGESDWNEAEAARQNGLLLVNVPIRKKADGLDANAVSAISAVVSAQKGQPVLLHCSSGNRAAGWLAIHLIDDHGLGTEEALAVARKAGLTSDVMEARVRTTVEQRK